MKSKAYIALFIFIIFSKNITAQSNIYIDAAQVFSTFKFSSDNQNNAPGTGYSTISTTSFGMGYEYIDSSGLLVIAGLGVRKAGSSMVLNKVNYTWNLQYLDLKAGIGYRYNKWLVKPYVALSPFYSQLLNARQTIGLNYYDIKTSNSIKSNDFGLFLTAGFSVPVSRYISIYLDYNYILGLRNLETTEAQYLYNRGSAFKLGLLLNLSTKTKPTAVANKDTLAVLQNKIDSLIAIRAKESGKIVLQPADTNPSALKSVEAKPTDPETTDTKPALSVTQSDTYKLTTEKGNEEAVNSTTDSTHVSSLVSPQDTLILKQEQNERLNEEQLKNISQLFDNQNITFKIQLVAIKNELKSNNSLIKNVLLPVKTEKGADGWFRYYAGSFKTYEKAHAELNKIKSNGIAKDAFIVAFKDGRKITVADAKKILK